MALLSENIEYTFHEYSSEVFRESVFNKPMQSLFFFNNDTNASTHTVVIYKKHYHGKDFYLTDNFDYISIGLH